VYLPAFPLKKKCLDIVSSSIIIEEHAFTREIEGGMMGGGPGGPGGGAGAGGGAAATEIIAKRAE